MNKNILNTGVQNFIIKNINTDIVSVLLKKPIFEGITQQELAEQIESKKKCKKKLSNWYQTAGIYFPKKINIEQTSSEITAAYKSEIVDGKSLVDLTGGFGVDSYYFSLKMDAVFHCEIDENLSQIAAHNFEVLKAKNVQNFSQDGLSFIKKSEFNFDWIYIDPSRRNEKKGKVFQLGDCLPNIPDNLNSLFAKSNNILIKTSPLLDLSIGIRELKYVKEIHIVAVENEVKELLWILTEGFSEEPKIKTINFSKSGEQVFEYTFNDEKKISSKFEQPLKYLYEPNAAILKAGAFKSIGKQFCLKKLHQHTHLYTSSTLIDFPGRRFTIEKILPFNKNNLKSLQIKKANISTRNFPESVATIRKKFKIKEGGEMFLFFLMNSDEKYLILVCSKTA